MLLPDVQGLHVRQHAIPAHLERPQPQDVSYVHPTDSGQPSSDTVWCRCRHMAYVSLVLDDHDEVEPAGTSDEGHYRCLSCALADASCGHSAVVMVRADLDELEGCAHEFEGACLEPPGELPLTSRVRCTSNPSVRTSGLSSSW